MADLTDDDQLAKILASGTLDQRDEMLMQQLQRAHALRLQRAGQQPYGAGAGMAAGLGSLLGGIKEGILQNRQEESAGKRQEAINALVSALRSGGGPSATSSTTPPEMLAAPQEQSFSDKIAGVAPPAAPRGNPVDGAGSGSDLARQRALGLLAIMTGGKQMGGIGEAMVGDVTHQQQMQAMAQRYALDRAIKEANEKRQEARDTATDVFHNKSLDIMDKQRRDIADQRSQDRADALAQRKAEADAKAAKEKEVPPRQLERYAQLGSTIDALGTFEQQLAGAATGPVWGRIQEANPLRGGGTSAALGMREALKVKVARALHGGVPTAIELKEADEYIPSTTDTAPQAAAKMSALKQLLSGEQENLRNTYGEGGLHIRNLSTAGGGAPAAASSGAVRKFTRGPDGQLVEVR